MTPRTRRIVLLVTAPVIAFAVVGGYLGKASARQDAPTGTCASSRTWST